MTPQQSISAYTGHPHCIRESLGLSIKFHENGLPQPIENGAKSWKNLAGGAIDEKLLTIHRVCASRWCWVYCMWWVDVQIWPKNLWRTPAEVVQNVLHVAIRRPDSSHKRGGIRFHPQIHLQQGQWFYMILRLPKAAVWSRSQCSVSTKPDSCRMGNIHNFLFSALACETWQSNHQMHQLDCLDLSCMLYQYRYLYIYKLICNYIYICNNIIYTIIRVYIYFFFLFIIMFMW